MKEECKETNGQCFEFVNKYLKFDWYNKDDKKIYPMVECDPKAIEKVSNSPNMWKQHVMLCPPVD